MAISKGVSRRDFIKTASLAAAGMALFGCRKSLNVKTIKAKNLQDLAKITWMKHGFKIESIEKKPTGRNLLMGDYGTAEVRVIIDTTRIKEIKFTERDPDNKMEGKKYKQQRQSDIQPNVKALDFSVPFNTFRGADKGCMGWPGEYLFAPICGGGKYAYQIFLLAKTTTGRVRRLELVYED